MSDHSSVDVNGSWLDRPNHYFDSGLAPVLKSVFEGSSIVDFGCGWDKRYCRYLNCDGYDGNPNTLDSSVLDLTLEFDLGRTYDVVLCLEVMEHIPQQHEETVLSNLLRHCGSWLVLSWAAPGQSGRNHVNCQPPDYVIEKVGLKVNYILTNTLRVSSHLPWFKKNILVFQRD